MSKQCTVSDKFSPHGKKFVFQDKKQFVEWGVSSKGGVSTTARNKGLIPQCDSTECDKLHSSECLNWTLITTDDQSAHFTVSTKLAGLYIYTTPVCNKWHISNKFKVTPKFTKALPLGQKSEWLIGSPVNVWNFNATGKRKKMSCK